jgi:hypothetical protein
MPIPYQRLLFHALLFGGFMTGIFALKYHGGTSDYRGGSLWYELLIWCVVGCVVAHSGWRAESYLDRKNADWRKRKDG